jgi:hypothetical protein
MVLTHTRSPELAAQLRGVHPTLFLVLAQSNPQLTEADGLIFFRIKNPY